MKLITSLLCFLCMVFSGCSVKHADVALSADNILMLRVPALEMEGKILSLQKALLSLSDTVDEEEARALAYAAVLYPQYLAERYALVSPPYLHNFLITLGLKDRGFCYHWAGDLMAYLREQRFTTLEFYRSVAQQGTLREHHGVVVTAKGRPFSEGVLLDAWRSSSELYFEAVTKDGEYHWEENSRYTREKRVISHFPQ